ncbi:histidine kinase [Brevibacterium sanguinis]|uniref:histidine kinase n=2 Tax=Brevibacterium TaxID=1696 RepID=A0A366IJH8_9MICO|nr:MULTISPECIES: histidine kinase [Brevibacterium]RBP65667.1 histidine kinase [Brevibacterium sanguinis]RBP72301.1 histidine kinase [Brevibacterium celere]
MTTSVSATTPVRRVGRPRAGIAVLIAAALPAVAGVVLQIASRVPLTPDALFLAVDAMVGLVYGTVAAVILSRRGHIVAWLIALTAVGGGLAALGGGWASFAVANRLPAEALGFGLFGSAWVPGTLALFLVVPWLVRETPLTRFAAAGPAVGIVVTAALTVQRFAFPMSDNAPILVAVVVWGLVTAAAVLWRHRLGPVGERDGLGLLALGTAVMALSFLPLLLVPYTSEGVLFLVPISHLACQALFPGALLVTVLRNRLWGIDLAVSRGVLAGLLTLIMVVVYAALVWTASRLVGSSAIAQLVAAVGVVLAVQPVRSLLGARVRRLVWGEAASAGRAALHIGATLSTGSRPAELLDRLAAAVGETLRLESATLTLPDGETAGHWGTPTSPPEERTVTRRADSDAGIEDRLGTLSFTPRPGERLDRRTLDALDRIEPLLAVGLSLIQATAEVTAAKDAATRSAVAADRAREATTRARLAERQLIRRELHDGIGPWLSGLHLGIQGARNILPADPAAADELLAALQTEAAQRVQDIRMVSRSLLPPILEERGLAAAVDELAARYAQTGFTLEVEGLLVEDPDSLRRLDDRVAAAAYAVIAESSLNSSRHSGVDRSTARVDWDASLAGDGGPEGILVDCWDQGVGRAADAPDGVGTVSMRERVEELGGSFATGPAPGGGTLVRTRLPLNPREETS